MIRVAAIAVLLAGCDLYFGGGGDDVVDPPCEYGSGASVAYEVRNPHNGRCEQQSGGGGWCDDRCIPCDDHGIAQDWGACYGHCFGLPETACWTTSGCYAAYQDDLDDNTRREFWGCWNTPPSGPVQGGGCANLDAYECSRHDDCSAVYNRDATSFNGPSFQQCTIEPLAYCVDDTGCGSDAFCDTSVCYPSPTCPSCPTCGACPDSNTCYGLCVPKEPMACDAIVCGPGYHCEEQCTGTESCTPACVHDITCETVACAPGESCAITCTTDANGQRTCRPSCVTDPTQCAALATESACLARTDCRPVYDGQDCTCYPDHCECQILTYERCEAL
jgi:hypothetical protein